MKVVLRADVSRLGNKGDVLDVADGYARNYLVPRGLALKASPGVVDQAAAMRRSRDVRDASERAAAEEIATKLVPTRITVTARAGTEGRLFGSVTSADLVTAVQAQAGVTLERKRIHLEEPIKNLGTHEVPIRLHPEVEFRLPVEVVPGK